MILSLPIVLILGLILLVFMKADGLKPVHAVLVALFGFMLASTGLASGVTRVDTLIASLFGGSIHP